MNSLLEFYLAQVLATAIAIPVAGFVSALFVQLSTYICIRFSPPYWMAYKAFVIGSAIQAIMAYAIVGVVMLVGKGISARGHIVMLIVGFVIQSMAYDRYIKRANGASLKNGKAGAVVLVQIITMLLVGVGLYFGGRTFLELITT